MKKFRYILFLIIITVKVFSHEYENLWGINQYQFLKNIPSDASYEIFKPQDKTDYSNKAVTFFQAMGGSETSVSILRLKETPEKDFCFFNDRLYSVSEEWKTIKIEQAKKLINNIENRYHKQNEVIKDQITIQTYEKNRTRVIVYMKPDSQNSLRLKILFYSNNIFNMLLDE